MFAALIALATTALVALVLLVTIAIVQRRRAPRSLSQLRHPARGVSAALLVLTLSAAALVLAFASVENETVQPRAPWAIVPASPVAVPPQLASLPLD